MNKAMDTLIAVILVLTLSSLLVLLKDLSHARADIYNVITQTQTQNK